THAGGPDVVYPSGEVAGVFSTDPGTPVDVMMRRAMRLISAPGFAEAHPEARLHGPASGDHPERPVGAARERHLADTDRPRRPRPADPVSERRDAREA